MSSTFLKVLKERKENVKTYHVGLYDLGETIGEGNFAKVKVGKHAVVGSKVAIKIIDKAKLSPTAAQKLVREVKIMKILNHPNICRLYEVIETEEEMFLIMEYAEGGELFDYLVAHGRMKEKDARKQFRQILAAIDFCHQKGVIHRDLKAENLLLDGKMNTKIADFGFSNHFTTGQQLNTWCGSPPYAAPELFQGKEYEGPEIDVWSLGVVLYVLVCGALPFDGNSLSALKARVTSGKFKIPFYMSTECEQLIKKMIVVDSKMRAPLDEVMKDPWINEGLPPMGDSKELEVKITPEQHKEVIKKLEKLGIDAKLIAKSQESGGYDYIGGMYNLVADQVVPRVIPEWLSIKQEGTEGTVSEYEESPKSSNKSPTKTPSADRVSQEAPQVQMRAPKEEAKPRPHSIVEKSPEKPEEEKTRKSRARSNTVNTKNDVESLRKDLLKKNLESKTTESAISEISTSPNVTVSAPSSPTASTPPSLAEPIPKDSKKRRQRALSLSTAERPATPARPSIIPTNGNTEADAFVPDSTSPTTSPLPSPTRTTPPNGRIGGSSRATVSGRYASPPRRTSFKDLLKKTFGIKEETEAKPRSLRFHFSVETTSARDPSDLVNDLESSLPKLQIAFERENFFFLCRKDDVAFELEVCKLPRLSLNGFRFKRLAGDQWRYKSTCTDVLNSIRL